MNAATHTATQTQGKWSVQRSLGGPFWLPVVDDRGMFICAVCERPTVEEAKANARLIAAAPELLQALKEALPYMRAAGLPGAAYNPTLQKMIKAIARAEGKE